MVLFENGNIRISVRNLVEFLLRKGNIDNRFTGKKDLNTMAEGAKLHRKIQGRMGGEYEPEVSLKIKIEYEDFYISVEGRADGVITPVSQKEEEPDIWIDEIKTTYADVEKMEESVFVHKAQAMCYGYIYGIKNDLDVVGIRLTYANLDTENIKHFKYVYKMRELSLWFNSLMEDYYKWAKFVYDHRIERNESARKIEFPFEYRDGQRVITEQSYKAMRAGKNLYIQAPTGVGKTMSVVFPAVKALGYEIGDKIFYLTAKTIAGTVATKAYDILAERGLKLKKTVITAKEKICINEETQCNPSKCPYALGHYDRVNDAVFDMITNEDDYSRENILKYAKKHNVCPFEMNLDASYFADMIICDYNYAFDPNAKLKRFFSEGRKEDYIFLVDEAHNLVDRAREMFSAYVCKEDFLEIKKIVGDKSNRLKNALERCNKNMLERKRECGNEMYTVCESVDDFSLQLAKMHAYLEKFLDDYREFEGRERVLEFYFDVNYFLYIDEIKDEKYKIVSKIEEDGKFYLKLMCVNPSKNLSECMELVTSTILFSGTFLPINYYKYLLTGNINDYAVYINSPFDKEKRMIAIAKDVSSKYTRRNKEEYEKISEYIKNVVENKKGNYMVFFPSYKFMDDIKEVFLEKIYDKHMKNIRVVTQTNNMNESDREEFLHMFDEENEDTLVAFCIMGGIFSEGIDLTGEKLIGVIVVGTGFPQVGCEREIIKKYFDEKNMNGFDYAYRYPGMNKVLQAAGRVIRTDRDEGVIALLDERFLSREYEGLFPREWSDRKMVIKNSMSKEIEKFWMRKNGLEE